MTTTQAAGVELPVAPSVADIIAGLRAAICNGETHWLLALCGAIRAWPLGEEHVGERTYHYLIGGEAFDWLLLAERLCSELDGLIPEDEVDDLLFHGRLPDEFDQGELPQLLGAKQRAHLNFVYGVRVEAALQLAVQEEVLKERAGSRIWENGRADDDACRRIYKATRDELVAEFRRGERPDLVRLETVVDPEEPTDNHDVSDFSLADLSEFTYWLFRRRVHNADPARVASDTRKGLAMLQRLQRCGR